MGLTNAQYDEIMREYNRRQNRALRDLDERIRRVHETVPGFSALEEQRSDLATKAAKDQVAGQGRSQKNGAAKTAELIWALSRQEEALLAEAGFPRDYLQPHYQCADCQDTGYVDGRKCRCFEKLVIELFYTQPSLKKALEEENFDTFRLDWYPEDMTDPSTGRPVRQIMKDNLEKCRRFAAEFDTQSASLLFTGGVGLGKTFLSHCIAGQLIASSHSVIYFSAYEMFQKLAQEAFGEEASRRGAVSDYLGSCDLLIIDDLGTEVTNSFINSSLFQILNRRIAQGRSTIISTNLSLSALNDTYSERSISRIISHFTILPFYGRDIRILKKLAGTHPRPGAAHKQ